MLVPSGLAPPFKIYQVPSLKWAKKALYVFTFVKTQKAETQKMLM